MRGLLSARKIAGLVCCLSLLLTHSANAVNVTFDGELIDRPCQIDPGSLNQTVQFLERPVKDFQYMPGRGPAEEFSIRLVDCDTSSIWKTVKLKFSGDNEPGMKEKSDWFLRVSGENQGKLAVGLLDTDGVTPLKLGDAHNNRQGTQIEGNTVTLNFKAFVQATPDAIAQKSVQPGEYKSVANFELFYE
ncbi:PapK protein [Escherichia coli]|uniref:fimbrial protein n=3 Tax=Escherichia coli TaxID=562 RepID=UPI0007A59799|nr:fimbrial protein [Escherichia coli]EEW6222670.1 type 1 fimbrial protein [Escherichia coli]EEW6415921.1 type 1 fimbrial protein [Escherichia coli]EFA4861440.1 type 1 fimbrial protein [Escherichia coli]EFA4943789.1 type 1 fimbrial protein [Escherichia coli]EFD5183164.1 type 1 fimbrial protein [Escherichia coli]